MQLARMLSRSKSLRDEIERMEKTAEAGRADLIREMERKRQRDKSHKRETYDPTAVSWGGAEPRTSLHRPRCPDPIGLKNFRKNTSKLFPGEFLE